MRDLAQRLIRKNVTMIGYHKRQIEKYEDLGDRMSPWQLSQLQWHRGELVRHQEELAARQG